MINIYPRFDTTQYFDRVLHASNKNFFKKKIRDGSCDVFWEKGKFCRFW